MNWKEALEEYDDKIEKEIEEIREAARSTRSLAEDLLRSGLVDGVEGDPDYVPPPDPFLIVFDDLDPNCPRTIYL